MRHPLRATILTGFTLTWLVSVPTPLAGQQPAAAGLPALTDEQIEQFLLAARVERVRGLNTGVTNSQRATLTDGQITHDAHIQTIDVSKLVFTGSRGTELNFRDSYLFNLAGYRLARLLGLDNVPPSVERSHGGKSASFTWWVDDVVMDEGARRKKKADGPDPSRTAMQIHIMRVFDALIHNTDRNAGNLLWTSEWKMWMIDHTRAFRLDKRLLLSQYLERCERSLFENMKGLTAPQLKSVVGDSLRNAEIDALLARRDLIIKLLEDKIAKKGETAVLYDFDD